MLPVGLSDVTREFSVEVACCSSSCLFAFLVPPHSYASSLFFPFPQHTYSPFLQVFCPRCQETYHPRSSKHANLDGAYFGTTFCHLFLLTHPELVVPKSPETYIPRIFGFRIHESSQYHKLR